LFLLLLIYALAWLIRSLSRLLVLVAFFCEIHKYRR